MREQHKRAMVDSDLPLRSVDADRPNGAGVSDHYRRSDLLAAIIEAIAATGRTPATIGAEALAPLDEFHIGGRMATADLVQALAPASDDHVVDVGCGLGGAARFTATACGCRVTGVDLTQDYVAAGTAISGWLGVDDRVRLLEASALHMPFADASFDAGYMIHVGMNVADKAALFTEIARVLKPGARFALYDVMRTGDGELRYPLPWATTETQSALATPADYRTALASAGFVVDNEWDRRGWALEYFARQRAVVEAGAARSPLGLHLLMTSRREAQVRHMTAAIEQGILSPTMMSARLASTQGGLRGGPASRSMF